jgi:transposase-like protein
MPDEIPVCPECDNAKIRRRTPNKPQSRNAEARWRCPSCDSYFAEALWRLPRSQTASADGTLVADLMAADPDDV